MAQSRSPLGSDPRTKLATKRAAQRRFDMRFASCGCLRERGHLQHQNSHRSGAPDRDGTAGRRARLANVRRVKTVRHAPGWDATIFNKIIKRSAFRGLKRNSSFSYRPMEAVIV